MCALVALTHHALLPQMSFEMIPMLLKRAISKSALGSIIYSLLHFLVKAVHVTNLSVALAKGKDYTKYAFALMHYSAIFQSVTDLLCDRGLKV